jgi:hypothetical protein
MIFHLLPGRVQRAPGDRECDQLDHQLLLDDPSGPGRSGCKACGKGEWFHPRKISSEKLVEEQF